MKRTLQKPMPERPDRMRVGAAAKPVGVDRAARVLRGFVVALAGPFKSEGRGEFDEQSLAQIVELWPAPAGLKSRWTHPTESSDGLGKHLGRARDPYLSTARVARDGQEVEVPCVRADLYFSQTAGAANPNGDLAGYVMDLAEEDPGAISSSLVLRKEEEYRLQKDGTPERDAEGEPLPPLWRVRKLYATDVVDEGDAVDGILAAPTGGKEPLAALRYTRDYLALGTGALDQLFAGQKRATVQARLSAWLNRYLDRRYGTLKTNKTTGAKLGPALGNVLDGYIEEAASDERPREVIIAQMAEASALPVEDVSAIIQGEDVEVPLPALQAFAGVLGCPLSALVAAAEEDGIDYAGGEDETPEAEEPGEPPAPGGPAGMSAPGVRRRRLELKAKTAGAG